MIIGDKRIDFLDRNTVHEPAILIEEDHLMIEEITIHRETELIMRSSHLENKCVKL